MEYCFYIIDTTKIFKLRILKYKLKPIKHVKKPLRKFIFF